MNSRKVFLHRLDDVAWNRVHTAITVALGIGWLLGPYNGLIAVFLAFVIGAVVAVCVLIPLSRLLSASEQITNKSEVPFGPFLVVSTILVWLMTMYGIPLPLFSW